MKPQNAVEPLYMIWNAKLKMYWSDKYGWCGYDAADIFKHSEAEQLDLPPEGRWKCEYTCSGHKNYPTDHYREPMIITLEVKHELPNGLLEQPWI